VLPAVLFFQLFVMVFIVFRNPVEGFQAADDDATILEVNEVSTVLMNLDKYCNYSVQVTAMTSVGIGPWSEAIICHTAEDGKGCWIGVFLWCHLIELNNSAPVLRIILISMSWSIKCLMQYCILQ
jgi:hypothetical protein